MKVNHGERPGKLWSGLADFELGERIGKGTTGVLFKVVLKRDPTKTYALKVVKKSKVKQMKMQQFLQREIEIHSTLSHPNVLKFHDFFTDNLKLYLLLELCDCDLYARLQERGRWGISVFVSSGAAM